MNDRIGKQVTQYFLNSILGDGHLSAAYLANGGMVTMEHLLHGARRELQKMGRLVGEKDLDIGPGRSETRQGNQP